MMIEVLAALAVLLLVLVVVIALRPSDFRVTRSALIPAPVSLVFEQVNDFHRWPAWSPWARLDPAARNTYEGLVAGEGAIFRWSGKKVGEGSMILTESRRDQLIRIQLEFLKPFRATNSVEFLFEADGENTLVTWSMNGKNNFMAKAVGLFMDCEKMCGSQFEQGLANLKAVAAEVRLQPARV